MSDGDLDPFGKFWKLSCQSVSQFCSAFSDTYTRHAAVPMVSLLVMHATVHLLRRLNSEVHRHRRSFT